MTGQTIIANVRRRRPLITFVTFFLLLVTGAGLLVGGGVLLLAYPILDQLALLLAQLAWRLIPPQLWLGAGLIVIIWLLTLHRAWTTNSSPPQIWRAKTHG
jgi:hypothetical protein